MLARHCASGALLLIFLGGNLCQDQLAACHGDNIAFLELPLACHRFFVDQQIILMGDID